MEQQRNGSNAGADIWAALSRPFSLGQIRVKVLTTNRDKTRGLIVPYVDARAVMDRLDEVVGPGGWSDSYTPLEGGAMCCTLRIGDVVKTDVGEGETPKSAVSDAFKRAGIKHGIGRHLYEAQKVWADLDERGQIVSPADVKRQVLSTMAPAAPPPRRPALRSSDEMVLNGDDLPF